EEGPDCSDKRTFPMHGKDLAIQTEFAPSIFNESAREHRCSQITDAAGIYVIEILRSDLIDSELESVFDAFPDLSPRFPRDQEHVGFEVFFQLLPKCDVQVLFQKVIILHRIP